MSSKSKANFSAYVSTPLMTFLGFLIASLVFTFILKEPSPVPVFIIFAVIQIMCMTLFAFLPAKGRTVVRLISMFLVGSFIMVLAGVLGHTNFQLEGFFFYLLTGVFTTRSWIRLNCRWFSIYESPVFKSQDFYFIQCIRPKTGRALKIWGF